MGSKHLCSDAQLQMADVLFGGKVVDAMPVFFKALEINGIVERAIIDFHFNPQIYVMTCSCGVLEVITVKFDGNKFVHAMHDMVPVDCKFRIGLKHKPGKYRQTWIRKVTS